MKKLRVENYRKKIIEKKKTSTYYESEKNNFSS